MTGAESLSLGTQPVTENLSALSLSWGVAGLPAEGVGRDSGSAAGEGLPHRQASNQRSPHFQLAALRLLMIMAK